MLNTILLVVHVISSIVLVLIILLQIGKGASLSNLFGGGSSDAVFSGAGGDVFMKKLTMGFAITFMVTSLSLTVLSSKQTSKTVMQSVPQGAPPQATTQQGEAPVPAGEEQSEPFKVK